MSTKKYNIGIVDDSKITRELVTWKLTNNPAYCVQMFSSGEELLMEKNFHPDLMILDHHLDSENKKAMDGLQLAKHFKNIPIIVLSGQQKLSTVIDFLHNGACDYIPKNKNFLKNVENSISEVINYMKVSQNIVKLKQKNKKDLFRMSIVLSLVILAIYISTSI